MAAQTADTFDDGDSAISTVCPPSNLDIIHHKERLEAFADSGSTGYGFGPHLPTLERVEIPAREWADLPLHEQWQCVIFPIKADNRER